MSTSIRFTSIAIRPKTPRNGWDKGSAMKRFIIIVCAVLLLAGGYLVRIPLFRPVY